jgi:peptide/nickel transport system permease protein
VTRYFVRRLAASVLLFLLVISLVFLLVHVLPGDATRLSDPRLPRAQRDHLRVVFGLDRSLAVQYVSWVRSLALRLDWGTSFLYERPVLSVLCESLPASLLLAATAMPLAYGLGLLLGILSARRPGSTLDHVLRLGALALYSMPVFWLGLMAVLLFSLHWPIFPPSNFHSVGAESLPFAERTLDLLRHLALPALVLALANAGGVARFARNGTLEALGAEYVQAARARGLSESAVLWRHALRSALPPIVQALGTQLPATLSGVLVVEIVFAWPGLGRLAYDALLARDYPLVLGWACFNALLVLAGGLLADLLHARLDPRLRDAL